MKKPTGPAHDRGGWPTEEVIDRSEHATMDWELEANGLLAVLFNKGLTRADEIRRVKEQLAPQQYEAFSYYERWFFSMETLMIEKGIVTREEIDRKVAELERREG